MTKCALTAALALATLLLLTESPQPSAAAIGRNAVLLHKPMAARRALQAVNFRKELVVAINVKRSASTSTELMTAAQVMANDMAKNDFVSATGSDGSSPTDRAEAQQYNSTAGVAELVGAGYEGEKDVMDAWIKSSDTQGRLFGNFTQVGLGYTFNKNQEYSNYWALDFATGGTNETCSGTEEEAPPPLPQERHRNLRGQSAIVQKALGRSGVTAYAGLLSAVNAARAEESVAPLRLCSKLQAAAVAHCKDMARQNFMSHTGSSGASLADRVRAQSFSYTLVGENVAAGQSSVDQVMTAWMNSTGHRSNILNPSFRFFGAGYALNTRATYVHYWTQNFAANGENTECE
ncbi:hypothetical protein PybrP1_012631 [[Pythium] brassicae (nom. inval.)]|nr:hypothetical protein PybrP1_012631 [[Pythium] brassicae (nom. inval.)]